jgi:PAS domain S-box-containing protein
VTGPEGQTVRDRPPPPVEGGLAAAELAVQELLDELLIRVRDALGVDTVAVLLLDEARDQLVARAAKGLEEEVEQRVTIPVGRGFAGRVVAQERPIVIEDIDRADIYNPILHEKGLRSLLGVPLGLHGEVFGVIHVGSLTPRTFSNEDVRLLELIAERVALPIAQSQLYQRERRQHVLTGEGLSEVEFLAEASAVLSSSLDYETTLGTVARLAVPRLADWCVIDLEEGGVVRRVAVVCADESKQPLAAELERKYPARPRRLEGTSKVLRTGEPEVAAEITDDWLAEIATDERELEILRSLGLRSNILVPVVVRGKTIGVLTLASAESGRVYGERDLRLAQELAARAALAVDNARLFRDEQAAREQVSLLSEASAILASSLDYEMTLKGLADLIVPRLADWCVVQVADESGELQRVGLAHADPERVRWAEELAEKYPDDPEAPEGSYAVLRSGEARLVPMIPEGLLEQVAVDEEHLRVLREVGIHSYMIVPLIARGRTLGVLSFVTTEESGHSYDEVDLKLAEELARRAALAVDNARLYRDALANQERLRFLAESGEILASSLAYSATLQSVARLMVPALADWCIVDVLDGDELRRVAVAAAEAEDQALLEELRRTYPPTIDSPQPAAQALREGEPVVFHEFTPQSLADTTRDDHHLELMRKLNPHSALAVPLVARGHTVGALTFAWSGTDRFYSREDLPLAAELARRVALAVDNARLYREAEERAEAALALERVGDGVVMVGEDGAVRLWNPAAEAITGLKRSAVLGHRITDIIPAWQVVVDRIPVAPSPAPAARAAETVPLEIEDRELWLSISGVSVEAGTVYAFRDLTEERALEKMRSDFVATISHELRTPLASVYGAAMTLSREDIRIDGGQRKRLLDVITLECDRLARIVNDILLTSRLDTGTITFSLESTDPIEAIDDAIEAAQPRLPEDVQLTKAADSAAPRIEADPEQLRQVLENLIDNALKYGPPGGSVEIGVGRRGRWACFWVRDEGPGIPESERERIFEKFYRLDPELLEGVGGTGLGLYISRQLIQRMDGRIWVEAEGERGATFFFELPLATPEAVA